ncbi:MAG: hypothetical protein KF819_32955 [Labilithrix sp.]|nr:hypothetical protein [Labilithrix sp.]
MPIRSFSRAGLAALLASIATFAAAPAEAAPCDAASLTCSVGTAASLKAQITQQLPTQIDSGWMDKGNIKIRTRFTIDPVGQDPLMAIDMQKGALVEATWPEPGYVNLKPVLDQGAQGAMNIRYTLVPSLEASIYGINVNYNASQLVNKIPGAKFNYDSRASAPALPWTFAGVDLKMPAPPLDASTIFSLPFSQLGVGTGVAEGTLSIQAAAAPTFKYITKQVAFDAGVVTSADGSAKIPAPDADFMEVSALVAGELSFTGSLDVRPVVKVDSVAGVPTFGLVKFSFSAVSKAISGAPMPVGFEHQTIRIPLANVKVPAAGVSLGEVKGGSEATKTITIQNTGELGAKLTFASSDPQFQVPSGEVKVPPKSTYDLKVVLKATNGGAASSTITVRSNDADSPEQSFKIGANGASVDDEDDAEGGGKGRRTGGKDSLDPIGENSGCSAAPGALPGTTTFAALGVALGLAMIARRRRAR